MLEVAEKPATTALDQLLPGEREVVELILARHTTKEIARRLELSPKGVEWRVRSARDKLGAVNRNDLARIYAELNPDWGKTLGGPPPVASSPAARLAAAPETPAQSRYVFHDAGALAPAPWEQLEGPSLPETLDRRFGKLWRIAAILLGALVVALLVVALLAMSQVMAPLV